MGFIITPDPLNRTLQHLCIRAWDEDCFRELNASCDRYHRIDIWCNIPQGAWAGLSCVKPLKVRISGRDINDISGLADYGPGFSDMHIRPVGEGVLEFPFSRLSRLDSLFIAAVEKRQTIAGLAGSPVKKLSLRSIRKASDSFALQGMHELKQITVRNLGHLRSFKMADAEKLEYVEITNAPKLMEFTIPESITLKSLWLQTVPVELAKKLAKHSPRTVYVSKGRQFPDQSMVEAIFPGAELNWMRGPG